MNKYITAINPFHTSVLRKMQVNIQIKAFSIENLQRSIELLATLESLEFLKLFILHKDGIGLRRLVVDTEMWKPLTGKLKECEVRYESWDYYGKLLFQPLSFVVKNKEVADKIQALLSK